MTGTADSAGRIPFNRPSIQGSELEYVRQAVQGGHIAMKGPFSERAAAILNESCGAADVLLTTSCTDALEMTSMLADIGPGDTVVVPSFTFVSTALAYARHGARLLFCDIEPRTLGLDPAHLAELMDDTVSAVVAVHYAGVGCDLDGITAVLADHPDALLIEDNAHGLFGTYRGKPLGSFGRFSTLSFHETKNFICGEGGALVVNHADDVDRAHTLLDKGTNRRQFLQGQVDKYTWTDVGSSFGMSDLLAAYLLAQLEERDKILRKRRAVFERYHANLAEAAGTGVFSLPIVPDDRTQAYHMLYVLLPTRDTRNAVLAALQDANIGATFHYVPLHSSAGGRRFAARPTQCPVTDEISGRLLRLPFFNEISDDEVDWISERFLDAVDRIAC